MQMKVNLKQKARKDSRRRSQRKLKRSKKRKKRTAKSLSNKNKMQRKREILMKSPPVAASFASGTSERATDVSPISLSITVSFQGHLVGSC
jgi:phosphate/sulfate permease